MNIFEFGDAKLRARDIDPIYTALWNASVPLVVREKFSIAETAFDHSGVAADVAQEDNFWEAMRWGVEQKLRGGSRRYFRGNAVFNSVIALQRNYPSYRAILLAMEGTFQQALTRRSTFPQFGVRAIFKLADVAENCNVFLEGILMSTYYGGIGQYSTQFDQRWIFAYLNTPVEICLKRILARRKKSGNVKEFDPVKTFLPRQRQIELSRLNIEQTYHRRTLTVDYRKPLPALLQLARKEG